MSVSMDGTGTSIGFVLEPVLSAALLWTLAVIAMVNGKEVWRWSA
jgi:hypothetical protein